MTELSAEISELQRTHKELTKITKEQRDTVLAGSPPFEASARGFESITGCFDIKLFIPRSYPGRLPRVSETSGKIAVAYDHINPHGTLCLGVPIEEFRIFHKESSLLGFVNNS